MSTGYLSRLVICFVYIITFTPYNTALMTKPLRCPWGDSHLTVPKRSSRLPPTRLLLARSAHSAAQLLSDTHPASTAGSRGQDSTPGLGPWCLKHLLCYRRSPGCLASLSRLAPGSRGTQCLNRRAPISAQSLPVCPGHTTQPVSLHSSCTTGTAVTVSGESNGI